MAHGRKTIGAFHAGEMYTILFSLVHLLYTYSVYIHSSKRNVEPGRQIIQKPHKPNSQHTILRDLPTRRVNVNLLFSREGLPPV